MHDPSHPIGERVRDAISGCVESAILVSPFYQDEIGATPFLDDRLRGLPVRIEFPVPSRRLVRRVQYRVIEEWIGFWHE